MEFYVGDRIEVNMRNGSPYPEMDGRPGTITGKYGDCVEWHYVVTLDEPIEHPSGWWSALTADRRTFRSVDEWLRPAKEQESPEPVVFGADLMAML